MTDSTTPQGGKAMPPASDGSVQPEQLDAIIEGLERIKALEAEVARLREVTSRAASHWIHMNPGVAWEGDIADAMAAAVAEIARLRLTDEEREAVEAAIRSLLDDPYDGAPISPHAATLRGLLERTYGKHLH